MINELEYWYNGKSVNLIPIRPNAYFYKGQRIVTEKESYTILGGVNIKSIHKRKYPAKDCIEYPFYGVLIESTNTVTVSSRHSILGGTVLNRYKKVAVNIGFLGEGHYSCSRNREMYCVWHNILTRCYNSTSWKKHPTYKNCTVDPRWHNFQNFCEDIQELEGYAEWKADSLLKSRALWEIDKDIKVPGNKIYSKNTCMFVTTTANISEMNKRTKITGLTYKALHSDGRVELFTNQRAFARKYSINQGHLRSVITGRRKTCKGWRIETIKEEKIVGDNK